MSDSQGMPALMTHVELHLCNQRIEYSRASGHSTNPNHASNLYVQRTCKRPLISED